MDRYPIPAERRRLYEALIRLVDLLTYAAVAAGGFCAVAFTPQSVVDELAAAPWLIVVWGVLLLGGGLVGFTGRLTRFWMVENPATVAAFGGIVIYLVVLGRFAFQSVTAAVAALLVLVAAAVMLRRWLELQIFGSEPGLSMRGRLFAATGRRTSDMAHRHR